MRTRGFIPETTKTLNYTYDLIDGLHKRMKVSKKDMAAVLGVSEQGYRHKLNHRHLTLDDLVKIMDEFGVKIEFTEVIR